MSRSWLLGLVVPVILLACVGDDPTLATPAASGPEAGGPSPPPAIDASMPIGDGASGDSAHVCAAPTMGCGAGGACVDVRMSSDHCGHCGHSCGGGACVDSACLPAIFRAGL